MRAAAVVPAAGRGERLGPGAPKALREVGGTPMLVHAVRALAQARSVDLVVVAAPPSELGDVRSLLASFDVPAQVEVVAGGDTRQQSVFRALAALPDDVDVVLVHDAARPLAPSELADSVVTAVRGGADAVVPVLPVVDTVKRVDPDTDVVLETVDRGVLRAVQTPQGFRRTVLARAHAHAGTLDATDDAGLVEALGLQVRVVPGHPEAFKVTRPLDLVLAEAVVSRRRAAGVR
ncbi:MAG TPA: 2-C-methyl-D-erythritol 4-phosphate cytidylyltransferase [Mycobacteriales bacterium]|jgi:2-C-methyl-D-erythritol 4-phosphate cytidylyltransferase|nr:2-C-methyl-D-erythritol 4-phosphate cytidylyltransferase [Mycobacteriales bacterium]